MEISFFAGNELKLPFFAQIVEAIEVKKGDQINLAVAGDFSFQISVGSLQCL